MVPATQELFIEEKNAPEIQVKSLKMPLKDFISQSSSSL